MCVRVEGMSLASIGDHLRVGSLWRPARAHSKLGPQREPVQRKCAAALLPGLGHPPAGSRGLTVRAAASARKKGQDDSVSKAQAPQLQATDLLSTLLQAPDLKGACKENIGSLTEEFFMVSSTYLDMAKKEGKKEVVDKLTQVLRVAMDEKNATLRPEIRLLNQLLSCEGDAGERKRVLNSRASGEALTSDNGYFFTLLEQVTGDVEKQPANPRKAQLLQWLADIQVEAKARLQPK